MATRMLPWLPWLLAEGTLAWLEARFWPDGGLWLLLIWTAVLLLYRAALAPVSRRSVRLVGDLVFAGLCILAVFEGGWYLLPAVVAFVACDAAGLTIELPSLPDDAEGHELGAALAATIVGWLGLAISVSGPIYASASSTVTANGVVVDSQPQVSLLQGLPPQLALLLIAAAAVFGLVTIAGLLHVRTGRHEAWWVLVAVTVALVVLVVVSTMTVGLWLVPGGALALASVRLGRPAQPSTRLL
jgi:hypothetical protein